MDVSDDGSDCKIEGCEDIDSSHADSNDEACDIKNKPAAGQSAHAAEPTDAVRDMRLLPTEEFYAEMGKDLPKSVIQALRDNQVKAAHFEVLLPSDWNTLIPVMGLRAA